MHKNGTVGIPNRLANRLANRHNLNAKNEIGADIRT